VPGLLVDGLMNVSSTAQVPVTCPQCFRVVQITAEQYLDEEGEKYVEAPVVWRAMSIHTRYGCIARRS
jgi:hypothetical protein